MQDSVFKRLITSMKFWTMILGGLATVAGAALAKYGLNLSDQAIQQIAGSIVVLTSILVHAQGQADLGKNATSPTTNNITVEAKKEPVSVIGSVSAILVVGIGLSLMLSATACTASARERTISTTLSSLSVADDAFVAWDLQHQKDIVSSAKSEQEGHAALTAYREKRAKVVAALDAAFNALAVAKALNDKHTLANALVAFAAAQAAWDDLRTVAK